MLFFVLHMLYVLFHTGPGNKPLFVLTGEGHRDELVSFVGVAIRYFGSRISTAEIPISPSNYIKPKDCDVLQFPSKVCTSCLFLKVDLNQLLRN